MNRMRTGGRNEGRRIIVRANGWLYKLLNTCNEERIQEQLNSMCMSVINYHPTGSSVETINSYDFIYLT